MARRPGDVVSTASLLSLASDARTARLASFLSRYLDGEHEQVWTELLALGEQVREELLYSDALAVARETMRRVRYNIELLIPRLTELGYQFGFPDMGEDGMLVESFSPVFSPPAANVDDLIAFLEQEIGSLPLALKVFYQVVGGVNLGGMDAGWQYEGAFYGHDPLEVWGLAEDVVEDCLFNKLEEEDLAEEDLEEAENLTAYHIVIAPDHHHKQGSSGGGLMKSPSLIGQSTRSCCMSGMRPRSSITCVFASIGEACQGLKLALFSQGRS